MESIDKQNRCWLKIRGYLDEIAQIVGSPVDLYDYNRQTGAEKHIAAPIGVDVWENSHALKDTIFVVKATHKNGTKSNVTWFRVVLFPGCCALCISTAAQVFDPYRHKGINNIANKIRQEIGKISGYTTMICTDVEDNTAERKTLARNGWADVYKVRNRRTNNMVIVSVKELNHDE